jgi:hypothetical protein
MQTLWLVVLLAVSSQPSGVELPTRQVGAVTAQVRVRVDEQPVSPGRGRARLTITVTGPKTLRVEGPRLEDALAGWRIAWQTSSWAEEDETIWETMLGLEQVKPGAIPLPGVRLRVREQDGGAWQDLSWAEPLQELRDVPSVIELPPLPAALWPRLVLGGGVVVVVITLLLGMGWLLRRWRGERQVIVPAWQQAVDRLGEGGIDHMVGVVRAFLEEQGHLAATRLTTGELLQALRQRNDVPEPAVLHLRELFEQGDLVKFAGQPLPRSTIEAAREHAREAIAALATWPSSENGPSGEDR